MMTRPGIFVLTEVRENLIEQAIEAVRQWRFRPGTASQ